ncbi:hypothetical protein [Streptomyces spinosirectus]
MSPHSPASGQLRSAAAVNEEIRALIVGTGRRLTDDEKRQLERLYEEWAATTKRAEVVKVA